MMSAGEEYAEKDLTSFWFPEEGPRIVPTHEMLSHIHPDVTIPAAHNEKARCLYCGCRVKGDNVTCTQCGAPQ